MATVRMTVAQAVVRFLANQYSERDGVERRLITGCWGIFGHGNVAGIAQGLLEAHTTGSADLPYYLARNEQGMVHAAVGYAKTLNRLQAMACTASVGPGSSNMLTGAALATVNRQLPQALLGAMRVLTDPAETGAVTLALPQDVQAEAADWPEELFVKRIWHIPRQLPEPATLARAAAVLREARRPLIVAGGGVVYSEATEELRRFAEATGIPVSDTHAGKGAIPWDHPLAVGGVGSTGSQAANALARDADVVFGIGTRYSDFTTASRTAFQNPDVRFVNLNVTPLDAAKHAGVMLVADARAGLEALTPVMDGYQVDDGYTERIRSLMVDWNRIVDEAYHFDHQPLPAQSAVLGTLNEVLDPRDVVVQAAGSMPGDLQMLWRASDPKAYHVEYGFSCVGYEIAGALGIKMADPGREVFSLVGDGSFLMMAQEIATAVSENLKLVVVIVQNHGYASIGELSEKLGSQRFGTAYRYRDPETGLLNGEKLPIDLAANAESLGAHVIRVRSIDEFRAALAEARKSTRTTAVHIETDPLAPVPSSNSWWDVPVSEVAQLDSTQQARKTYEAHKANQRPHITPAER